MPTAYIKKLAKLNKKHISTIEKYWSQAKQIAKSENMSKNWGLITTIFKNKLKANGLKVVGNYIISSSVPNSFKHKKKNYIVYNSLGNVFTKDEKRLILSK